jgi:hypothetical protein
MSARPDGQEAGERWKAFRRGPLKATRINSASLNSSNAVQAEPKRRRIARKRHLDALCACAQRRAFAASN